MRRLILILAVLPSLALANLGEGFSAITAQYGAPPTSEPVPDSNPPTVQHIWLTNGGGDVYEVMTQADTSILESLQSRSGMPLTAAIRFLNRNLGAGETWAKVEQQTQGVKYETATSIAYCVSTPDLKQIAKVVVVLKKPAAALQVKQNPRQ